jgi:hypothetical protein
MNATEARTLCDHWLPLWTGNRPDALIEAYADDVFYRDPARPAGLKGRSALLAYLRTLLARFPDWTWEADELLPLEGGFALRWRATIPLRGSLVRETGLDLVLVADGRITRNEVYFDRAAMLAALAGRA